MPRMTAVFAVAALAACASKPRLMSDAECASADWGAYGYQDGVAGAPPSLGSERAAACYERGFGMDRAAYDAGRSRGLASFCAPPRAYRMGASGVPYRGQCAGLGEAAFTAEYERGYALFGYTDAVDRAASWLFGLEAEREQVRTELARLAGSAPGLPSGRLSLPEAAARTAYLYQAERRLTERDIPGARAALADAEAALADYQANTAQ